MREIRGERNNFVARKKGKKKKKIIFVNRERGSIRGWKEEGGVKGRGEKNLKDKNISSKLNKKKIAALHRVTRFVLHTRQWGEKRGEGQEVGELEKEERREEGN